LLDPVKPRRVAVEAEGRAERSGDAELWAQFGRFGDGGVGRAWVAPEEEDRAAGVRRSRGE
jgi:hypothetical protein